MTTISRSTLLSIICLFLSDFYANAQCKAVTSDPVKGEFSINTIKVNGDGNGEKTASNNIPIKICEGELIKLQSTLPVTSLSTVAYWIMPYNSYNGLPSPPSTLTSAIAVYSTVSGNVEIKMIDNSSDPKGFSFYTTPGLYVITQRDNSSAVLGSQGFHHACQVIEIIKPVAPVATYDICSGGQVNITFPISDKNIYDDYQIQFSLTENALSLVRKIKTGKPSSYPFVVKNNLLVDFEKVKITIQGQSVTGGCPADKLVYDNVTLNKNVLLKPTLSAIVGTTQSGEFKLALSGQNDTKRSIYLRDPSNSNSFDYATVFKSHISTTNTLDSIIIKVPNVENTYCFQAEGIDVNCASSTSISELRSNELCTTAIKVEAQNNKNVITWSRAIAGGLIGANFVNYVIERFRPDGTFDKVLNSTPNITETSFTDASVTCGQEYVYKVTTRYPLKSTSQSFKVKAVSNDIPSKIPRLFTSIQNTKLFIQGQFNNFNVPVDILPNTYKFYKSESLDGIYNLANTGNSLFNDSSVEIDKKSYCYYMTWTNLCNIESEQSNRICSTLLTSDGINLNWTSESPLSAGTDSYIIQEVNKDGINLKEVAVLPHANKNIFDLQKIPLDFGETKFIQIETRPIGWNVINPNVLPSTLSNVIRLYKNPLANELEINESIKIYPVPSQDIINIELKTEKSESFSWFLSTMTGQIIGHDSNNVKAIHHQIKIDVKDLNRGTYILRIQSGDRNLVRKIVKE